MPPLSRTPQHLLGLTLAGLLALVAADPAPGQSRDSDAAANSNLNAGMDPPKSTADMIAEIAKMLPPTPFDPPTAWEDVNNWLTKVELYLKGVDPDIIPDDTRDPQQMEEFNKALREMEAQLAGFDSLEDMQRAIDEVQQGIDDAINTPGTDAVDITIDDNGNVEIEEVSSEEVLEDLSSAAPVTEASGGLGSATAGPAQTPGGMPGPPQPRGVIGGGGAGGDAQRGVPPNDAPKAGQDAGLGPAAPGIVMTDQGWSNLRINPEVFMLVPSR